MQETNNIIEYKFICRAANGLHARPANKLEQIASSFSSQITIENLQNGKTANARSILSLIAADVKADDNCLLKISGDDSGLAYKELTKFIEDELPGIDDGVIEESIAQNTSYISPVLSKANVKIITARPVTSGFGRGTIIYIDGIRLPEEIANSEADDINAELDIIEEAFARVSDTLIQKSKTPGLNSVESQIIQAHVSIIGDLELKNNIVTNIKNDRLKAGQAILHTFKHYSDMFENAQSQLIRDRISDLQDIRNQLINTIYGKQLKTNISLDRPSICIADCMSPSEFIALDKKLLSGLILKEVGLTSHIVILARSCNIPILTDVQCADLYLPEGQEVIIDSNYGLLLPELNKQVIRFYDREMKKSNVYSCCMAEFVNKPATTRNGKTIKVMANIAMTSEVETAIENGAEGIGLYRTEMMMLGRENAPSELEQFNEYKNTVTLAAGNPVCIRTFDIGGDKNIDFISINDENNPYLGCRGVRVYYKYKELFQIQLKAILRASNYGTVQILIPMISTLDEVLFVKEVLDCAKQELDSDSIPYDKHIKLGIMAEVPSAAYIIPQLAELIDFINIGTNDLKQYFYAADRENLVVSSKYPDHHPPFLALLNKIVTDAHNSNLQVCICGEMAGKEEYLPLIIGSGVDSISVSVPFIGKIKTICSLHDSTQCCSVLKKSIQSKSIDGVNKILDEYNQTNSNKGIIETELVNLDVDCVNKEEVIKYIADTLYLDNRTSNSVNLEKDFWMREHIYSTGLGHGFAIPHCKTKNINKNSICVFRLQNPVEWQSIDNEPVEIVIAMTIKEVQGSGDTHMNIFSKLARNIMHKNFQNQLKNINEKDAIVRYLKEKLELNC